MTYKLTLYREIGQIWHYVRLSVDAGTLITEAGCCGYMPDQRETISLPPGADVRARLQEEGAIWQQQGYNKPPYKTLFVMTLHFHLPPWKGAPAGAPWFDSWTELYLDPIEKVLEETCNAIPKGGERFSGNQLYYYMVLNPERARASVEKIAEQAQHRFALEVSIDRKEKAVQVPLNPNIPDFLQSMLRGFEQTARLLAGELPALISSDPLQPESHPLTAVNRVRGAEAAHLRQKLHEKWAYNCQWWTPPASVRTAAWFALDEVPESIKTEALARIGKHGKGNCYLLECDHGLFKITPEQIFSGVYEGIAFDSSFEWVVYFSKDFTITLAGEWLVGHGADMLQADPILS